MKKAKIKVNHCLLCREKPTLHLSLKEGYVIKCSCLSMAHRELGKVASRWNKWQQPEVSALAVPDKPYCPESIVDLQAGYPQYVYCSCGQLVLELLGNKKDMSELCTHILVAGVLVETGNPVTQHCPSCNTAYMVLAMPGRDEIESLLVKFFHPAKKAKRKKKD